MSCTTIHHAGQGQLRMCCQISAQGQAVPTFLINMGQGDRVHGTCLISHVDPYNDLDRSWAAACRGVAWSGIAHSLMLVYSTLVIGFMYSHGLLYCILLDLLIFCIWILLLLIKKITKHTT